MANIFAGNGDGDLAQVQKQTDQRQRLVCLGASFIAVLLLYGINSVPELNTDTYFLMTTSGGWLDMIVRNGRILTGLVYYVIEVMLHLSFTPIYYLSYCAAMLFMTGALFLYAQTIWRYFENRWLPFFLAIILITNHLSVEYFLFIEKGMFALAILLTVWAFRHTIRFLENRKIRDAVIALMLLICVVYIYQPLLGTYFILCLPFILFFSKNITGFLLNNVIVAGFYGIGMGVGFITTRFIFHSIRLDNGLTLQTAFPNTLADILRTFLNSGRITPFWFMPVCTLIAVVFSIWHIARRKEWAGLLSIVYIVLVVTVVAFLPYFALTTDDIYAARIKYPFGCMVGTLLLSACINHANQGSNSKKWDYRLLIAFCTVMYLIQVFSFDGIFIDRYKTNQMDRSICHQVMSGIADYENESGYTVTKVAIYRDGKRMWSHPGLNHSLLNTRAHVQEWSDLASLNFYANANYARGAQDEKVSSYFRSQNWSVFDSEQLIFDGDTLHWCIY